MSSILSCLTCCCCCCCPTSRHKEVLPCRTPVYTTAACVFTSLGFVLAFTALYLGDWYTCSWRELNLGTWAGKVVLQFGLSGMKLRRNEDAVERYPSISIARECQEMAGGLVADHSKVVSESDCQVADAVLVTTAATGT
ncbi:hypothetical protein FOZ62_011351, partial [Perkinsus olseni]